MVSTGAADQTSDYPGYHVNTDLGQHIIPQEEEEEPEDEVDEMVESDEETQIDSRGPTKAQLKRAAQLDLKSAEDAFQIQAEERKSIWLEEQAAARRDRQFRRKKKQDEQQEEEDLIDLMPPQKRQKTSKSVDQLKAKRNRSASLKKSKQSVQDDKSSIEHVHDSFMNPETDGDQHSASFD
jgi:hypothetical protein